MLRTSSELGLPALSLILTFVLSGCGEDEEAPDEARSMVDAGPGTPSDPIALAVAACEPACRRELVCTGGSANAEAVCDESCERIRQTLEAQPSCAEPRRVLSLCQTSASCEDLLAGAACRAERESFRTCVRG